MLLVNPWIDHGLPTCTSASDYSFFTLSFNFVPIIILSTAVLTTTTTIITKLLSFTATALFLLTRLKLFKIIVLL